MALPFSATSQAAPRYGLVPSSKLDPMETSKTTQARVRSRDQALGLLQRLTVGAAVGALAGVGAFAAVSAATIPGSSSSSSGTASSSSTASASSNSTTTSGSSTSS